MDERRSQVSPRTVWTVGAHALIVFATAAALFILRRELSWLALAIVLALTLEPVIGFLQRHKVPRGLGVAIVLALVAGAAVGAAVAFIPVFQSQVTALHESGNGDPRHKLVSWLTHGPMPLQDLVRSGADAVAAGTAVLGLTVLYLLFGKELESLVLGLLPHRARTHAANRFADARQAVGRYLAATSVLALLGAIATAVLLAAVGVPYYLALGFAMLWLGFIPSIGPAIGAVLVGASVWTAEGPKRAAIALAIFLVYQAVAGAVLGPLIQGKSLKMNPLLMTLALLAGVRLGGVIGAIIALPLAAVAQARVKELQKVRAARASARATEHRPPFG